MSKVGRIIAIVQARMGSSRLPGKVLLDVAGEPMIVRVVERIRRAQTIDSVTVATTTEASDGAIADLCAARGYLCYRGSLHDVLDRCYQAALKFQADVVVRITADCPLIDSALIDEVVNLLVTSHQSPVTGTDHCSLLTDHLDFVANRLPPPWQRTYPIGLDTEACTFVALERAWKEATEPYHREHVMPYLYEGTHLAPRTSHLALGTSPRGFHIALLHHDPDYGSLRWTVDTAEDLELVRQVYARFGNRDDFSWRDVLALFEREPELAQINVAVRHKTAFDVDARRNLPDQEP